MIDGIHEGLPLYPLLQLKNIFDVEDLVNWKEDYGINDIILDIQQSISDAMEQVSDLENQIDKPVILDLVGKLDTSLNAVLNDILSDALLTSISEAIQKLQEIADVLPTETLKDEILVLIDNLVNLGSDLGNVQNDLKDVLTTFGDPATNQIDMTNFTKDLFSLVENAFDIIPSTVTDFANGIIDGLVDAIDELIPEIIDDVNNNIGKTEPLGNIYDATYTHACLELVSPLNSIWSGLGFTLLLIMFPLTLLSCTVIKMLGGKREEKYMRPYSSRNRSVSMHDIGQPAYKNAQNYPMRQFQNNNNVPGYYGNNQRSNKH